METKDLNSNTIYIREKMIIKQIFITLYLATICTFCFGQKAILLTKQNGVYTIPCSICGIKKSLVFDTGASDVTISMELAQKLYNLGKLTDSDIKGFGKSQIASGHIINNMTIVLRDVEISGLHLKNVDAVVIEGQNVPLLLGLSAIQKLGKITLSGNKLIIDSSILSSSHLSEIRDQIRLHINKEEYSEAIALLKRIEEQDAIEEIDLFNLAQCYCNSEDYNKALIYCQQWMGLYKDIGSPYESNICCYMAMAYMGLDSFYEADKWFAQAIQLVGQVPIEQTNIDDAFTLAFYYSQKAVNYIKGDAFNRSIEAFDIATQYRMKALGYSVEDLCVGRIKDDRIGNWLETMSEISAVFLKDETSAERYVILAALCGNQKAIETCNYLKIDYSRARWFYDFSYKNK